MSSTPSTLALIASTLTGSLRHRVTTRSADRRLRTVARTPELATASDIEMLVRAHGLAETKVWAICDALWDHELDAPTVWRWVLRYDGDELARLLTTGLHPVEVTAHLEAGTMVGAYAATPLALAA